MSFRSIFVAAGISCWVADAQAERPVLDIASLRDRYVAAVSALHSVDCQMYCEWKLIRPAVGIDSADLYSGSHLHLWRQGTSRAILTDFIDGNGNPSTRSWHGFDGKMYCTWVRNRSSPDRQPSNPAGMRSHEKDNLLYEGFTFDRLTGETLGAGDTSLAHLLSLPAAHVDGWEDIDGHPSVRVVIPRHIRSRRLPDELTTDTTAWLDPEVRYLPRKIEWHDFQRGFDRPPFVDSQTATDFTSYSGADGSVVVLPSAGYRKTPLETATMKVVSLTVNGPLSGDLFRPDFPPQTVVLDAFSDRTPHRWTVGEQAQQPPEDVKPTAPQTARPEVKRSKVALSIPAPSAAPQDARRTSDSWRDWRWSAPLIGLVSITVFVGWLAHRSVRLRGRRF